MARALILLLGPIALVIDGRKLKEKPLLSGFFVTSQWMEVYI